MLRESLIWREEELARNALVALDAGNFVSAALLTRAVMETTGAIVYLHAQVSHALEHGISSKWDEKLTGFLTGSKVWDDLAGAVHVNDMLREVQKVIPGYFDDHYAMLSEFAHPNWSGALGAFGIINEAELTVSFARGGRSPDIQLGHVLGRLSGAVGLFTHYYNALADMILPLAEAVVAFHAMPEATGPTEAG